MRITLESPDDAYYLAEAMARDQKRSLGRLVGELILLSTQKAAGATITMSDYGFPIFRCARPVTTEEIQAPGAFLDSSPLFQEEGSG